MTAVDFAAFVERLAQVSGEVILPFFRSAIRAEDKSLGGRVRSRHRGRPGRRSRHAAADRANLPGPRRDRRRIWARPTRGGICLGPRSDRRDQELRFPGCATWGTLIGLMHHGQPVYGMMAQPFHARAVLWRRQGARAHARSPPPHHGDAPPSEWATRTLHTRACASLAEATLMTTSPLLIRDDADRAAYTRGRKRSSAHALWRRLLRLLRARGGLRRSRDRGPISNLTTSSRSRPSSRARGGRGDHLGRGRTPPRAGRIIAAGDRAVYDEARRLLLEG